MKIQIDGVGTVEVGDDFVKMQPEQQNAFIAHITEQAQGGAKSGMPGAKLDKYQQAAQEDLARQEQAGFGGGYGLNNSILNGQTLGAAPTILSALNTPVEMIKHGTFDPTEGYAYAKARQDMRRDKYRDEHLILDVVGNVAGGIATGAGIANAGGTLVKAGQGLGARTAAMAGEGAAYGGVTGFNEGDGLEGRLTGAAKGGLLGGAIGGALRVVGAAGKAAFAPAISNYQAWKDPAAAALARLLRGLSESGKTPEEVARAVSDAAGAGQGVYTLADALGSPGQNLLSTVARAPGEGRTAVTQFLNARQSGQGDRVGSAIDQALGVNGTAKQATAQLFKQGDEAARPIYKEAMAGGSTAPLETHFQNAFGEATKEASDAAKGLAAAQQQMTLAQAAKSRAGDNVYGVSSANEAMRAAQTSMEEAQRRVAASEQAKQSILGRLRQAQQDGSANAPGAVWTPRIQQFLDDPIMQQGLATGVKLQRLEALAKGKPFNPTELAITGSDEAGNPIINGVPNMRTLQAAKIGLDKLVEEHSDPITGRMTQMGRAINDVRKAFLGHLNELNPKYAEANAAYGGPAQVRQAIETGRDMARGGRAADNLDTFGQLSPINQQGARIGYADKVNEGIERGRQGVNAADRFSSEKFQTELPALSLHNGPYKPGQADALNQRLAREMEMFETRRIATGGSRTADNLANEEAAGIDPRIFWNALRGNFGKAAANAIHATGNVMTGNTPAVRSELASLLLRSGDNANIEPMLENLRRGLLANQERGAKFSRGLLSGGGEFVGQRR